MKQLKRLSFVDVAYGTNTPDTICVVDSASGSLWLKKDPLDAGRYTSLFRGFEVMTHNDVAHEFTLTYSDGRRVVFFDNSTATQPLMTGRLKRIIEKSGKVITASYADTEGRISSFVQTDGDLSSGYYYEYIQTVANNGKLSSVTLIVNDQNVRRARYDYYSTGGGGSVGDLRSVVVEQFDAGQSVWLPVTRKHYRYYVSGEPNGFVAGLKYVVQGLAYQRMVDSGLNPETSTDAEVSNFANYFFQYDSARRVTLERIEGGRKEFTFSYFENPADPALSEVNTWAMQTIESRPDGNENRVYTNKAGQVILKILREVGTGRQWFTYTEFTTTYAVALTASSFAVQSVTEPGPSGGPLTVVLKSGAGMITQQVFYTADEPSTGAVAGYLEKTVVKEGTAGTPVTLFRLEYDSRTAYGQTIHPLRARTAYATGSSGSGDVSRTAFSYTWYDDADSQPSFQVREKVTTYPVVAAAENGSDVAGVAREVFDIFGRLIWTMNTRGAITSMSYDLATGAMIRRIDDVDTSRSSDVPSGWTTLAGWGLHLVTDRVVDALGRVTQVREPWHDVQLCSSDTTATSIRRVEFTAYVDTAHEVRRASGYMTGEEPTAAFQTIGAVRISRSDESGNLVDEIQATRNCDCGTLNATETFPQSRWVRWTHQVFDTWGRLFARRQYHQIPARGEGLPGTNYLETLYGYDGMGRDNLVIEPAGTIERSVFDVRGMRVARWVGTNDFGATDADPSGAEATGNNMKPVLIQEYDNGAAGGDGNLTKETLPVDDLPGNDRISEYEYDFRNRRVLSSTTDDSTIWLRKVTFDNLDRPLQTTLYKTAETNANRLQRGRIFYDALGRVYKEETDGIDPANGNVVGMLTAQKWFDLAGNLIKEAKAGATSFRKTVFDAVNRQTVTYLACKPGQAGVPAGDDNNVTSDTVMEQTNTTYDRGGNVVAQTLKRRFDDASGTGPLGGPLLEPKSRDIWTMTWPDAIGRPTASAEYGTNGGVPPVRPQVAPDRSDTVLVTTHHYKDNGDANALIDPMGNETRWENDQAGRRVRLIENFIASAPEVARVTEFVWHPNGQLDRLILVNAETGDQVTRWIFGTTLAESAIASNNLLRTKIYPESDDRPAPAADGPDGVYARQEFRYNRQSQNTWFQDADETVHEYVYDKLGRQTEDRITAISPDLDNTVMRIQRSYDQRGQVQTVSSYEIPIGGTVLNQVAFSYDAFGNLIADKQSHSGPVTAGTPSVGYSYADGSTNTVRRTAITYPDGRILTSAYGAANSMDDHLGRISALKITGESANLVEYSYLGTQWQSRIAYPAPGIECQYRKPSGTPDGDAGDPYTGYDRFGRTVDLRWTMISSGTMLERLQYGFDRDNRRTWRRRPLTTGGDDHYGYDGLGQVISSARGNLNLNTTAIAGRPASDEAWNYDPTGNWQSWSLAADGLPANTQNRVHDRGNRLTQVIDLPFPVVLDRAGRMRQFPNDPPGSTGTKLEVTWDAWSRVTKVKSGGVVVGSYSYDGLTRRITRDVGGITLHTYYNDQWRPLEERRDDQTYAFVQYLWGARHRDDLARRDRIVGAGTSLNETRYVLMDYFSPAAITDASGAVTERYAFGAFGFRSIMAPNFSHIASSECDFDFAFQGQFLDSESGMLNYGYRYYAPGLGRWISKDPIGEDGGTNLYRGMDNGCVNKVDHYGLLTDGPPDCCNPCKAYSDAGKAVSPRGTPIGGTNVCCKGKLYSCSFSSGAKTCPEADEQGAAPTTGDCINDCICAHERAHQKRGDSGDCAGKGETEPENAHWSPGRSDPGDRRHAENMAAGVEMDCLDKCDCKGDPVCERRKKERKKQLQGYTGVQ
ncbi:MAG: RHS repeat-associated core domain-containing protein [Verrucomicrobiales bacterium]|nr:RHS repeat-associated core domain-containing protein [Verrucomicrobiales bacterium]